MAIKAGQLIHVANQILVDRAQTAGPGTVNINRTKIYELGNYRSVGSVTDLPDLTFTLESFDASAELEATMTGKVFGAHGDQQTVTITGVPTGGDFTLTFNDGTTSATTAAIAFDAIGATVQTRLVALANIDPGEVTVTGAAGGPYVVTFLGELADSGVNTLTFNAAGLTGGTSPSLTITPADTMAAGTAMRLDQCQPLDVASQFKGGTTAADPFATIGAVAIPYLALESMSYKFGVTDNASQTATLRGDGLFYAPAGGSAYIKEVAGTNTANQAIVLDHTAYPFPGDLIAGTKYAVSVTLTTGERLTKSADYDETPTGAGATKSVTITIHDAVPTTTTIRVTYLSDVTQEFPQGVHATVAPTPTTRPAAIRGRNITASIGGVALADRWTSIQSVSVDWKVNLQRDEEFGNSQIVSQDYDVPDVTGNLVIRPRNYAELYKRIRTVAGVTDGDVASALTTVPIPLYIELHSPDDGAVLKSFYISDARFNLPGFQGRVQQKMDVTFDWSSDTGDLTIYKGRKAGAST